MFCPTPTTVIARSASDEAIQTVSAERAWIASLTLAMTEEPPAKPTMSVIPGRVQRTRTRNLAQHIEIPDRSFGPSGMTKNKRRMP
jgi:hypothetical protein